MSESRSSVRFAITSICLLSASVSCGGRSIQRGTPADAGNHDGSSVSFAGNGGSENVASVSAGDSAGGSGNSSGVGDSGGMGATRFSCSAVASQQFDAAHMQAYHASPEVTASVAAALSHMTLAEKASQMLGIPVGDYYDGFDYTDIFRSPDVQVADWGTIRGYWYRDGDRGVSLDAGQPNRHSKDNFSTVFPAASARAASWDVELEMRVGAAIGDETAASLNNVLLAPCMNIVRHPYWGRTQETYGEDMYSIGRMASAFTVGLQRYVTGCAKHFAANNIEKGRSCAKRDHERADLARDLRAALRDGRAGRRHRLRDGVLQPDQWPQEHAEQTLAAGHSESAARARRLWLPRLRDLRLVGDARRTECSGSVDGPKSDR